MKESRFINMSLGLNKVCVCWVGRVCFFQVELFYSRVLVVGFLGPVEQGCALCFLSAARRAP